MRANRTDALQWFALFGGALAWALQLVLGYGVAAATCSAVGTRWDVDLRTWELTLMGVAAAIVLLAEAAALLVLRRTGGVEEDGPPPDGRRRFLAAGAAAANVLFLGVVLMSGVGAVVQPPCHAS